MHNDYVQPAGLWPEPHAPTPDQLQRLDQTASEAVNGDGGGTWAPASPLVIGGAGVQSNAAGGFSGPIRTGRNARAGGALVLGDNDLPRIFPPKTVSRIMTPRDFYSKFDQARPDPAPTLPKYWPIDESTPGRVRSLDYTIPGSFGIPPTPVGKATHLLFPIPSHLLVNGAMFSELRFRFSTQFAAPAFTTFTAMPGFRVVRCGPSGSYLGVANELYVIPAWTAATPYLVGALVIPAVPNGYQFRCFNAGTSGGSQPGGFSGTSFGSPVTDGGVTWIAEPGPATANGHFCNFPFVDTKTFFNAGRPQDIEMNALNGLAVASSTIDLSTYSYAVEFYDPTAMLTFVGFGSYALGSAYHSFRFTMSGITNLSAVF